MDSDKQRIDYLRETLHRHNHNYYVLNSPEISDHEFDMLMKELEELESRLAVLAREKGRALFLQADTAVPYGVVVDVMGRVKAAGIDKLGVLALPSGSEPAPGQTGKSAASR